MAKLVLDGDEVLEHLELSGRQVPLVSTGLAPTEDVPRKAAKGADTPAAYAPCRCGVMVLTGLTAAGQRLALDPSVTTYSVLWLNGEPMPQLRESRGYPVHVCPARPS
jgi:hypothetical protein